MNASTTNRPFEQCEWKKIEWLETEWLHTVKDAELVPDQMFCVMGNSQFFLSTCQL